MIGHGRYQLYVEEDKGEHGPYPLWKVIDSARMCGVGEGGETTLISGPLCTMVLSTTLSVSLVI